MDSPICQPLALAFSRSITLAGAISLSGRCVRYRLSLGLYHHQSTIRLSGTDTGKRGLPVQRGGFMWGLGLRRRYIRLVSLPPSDTSVRETLELTRWVWTGRQATTPQCTIGATRS